MSTDNPYNLDLSRPTRELVFDVATRLLAQGEKPSVGNVRAIIGKGSNLTIQSALNDWWKDLGQRINALFHHPTLPDPVITSATELWAAALREADLSNERYRLEADNQVVEAEARARVAEESLKLSEEGRQTVLGELDSANATIDGLERTLAAEVAHKNALAKQVEELNLQSKSDRQEADTARKEASEEMAKVRKDASEEMARTRNEFHEQLSLAQERFEAIEKRKMVEIDQERQRSAAARDAAQKEIERIRGDYELETARLRQRNNELSGQNRDLAAQLSKFEGQIEELAKQRDKLFSELSAALSRPAGGKAAKLTRRVPIEEWRQAVESRRERNMPIFEEHLDEITSRLDGGEKPSEVAAWLNTLGFEGDGATLNGLLRQAGLW